MINRVFVFCLSMICSSSLFAFPCVVTFVKSNCWVDYDVTITLIDVANEKTVLTSTLPKQKLWERKEMNCNPRQTFHYTATFTPEIWEGTAGKVYKAIRFWTLPEEIKKNQTAWEIPICFSDAFAEVPLPPKVSGNCGCDFAKIPAIPPR